MAGVQGLLLAAGAGRRMGMPKALKRDPDGTSWLARSVDVLLDGGCEGVTVVLGACGGRSAQPRPGVEHVICPDWEQGLGASLAFGLGALAPMDVDAALIQLVDLPDVNAAVAQRLLTPRPRRGALRRAVYHGSVGHPVILGRDHWGALVEELEGDRGAGAYLQRKGADRVECGDLATGRDVDFPSE